MTFILTSRAFILPFIAGVILFFRQWIWDAPLICICLNILALAAITLDYFILPDPAAFVIRRILPEQFFLHMPATIQIHISYKSPVPFLLKILDRPPHTFDHNHTAASFSCARGYDQVQISYEVSPRMRGVATFDLLGLNIASKLRLVFRKCMLHLPQNARVFPRLPTEQEGLQSYLYISRIESRIQKTYGPGREFSQMREYQRGDDIRSIHWKRSARAHKLIIKEFEPEKGQTIFMMIDGGRLMMAQTEGMSKTDWALSSCISLAAEALKKHDSVGALCFTNKIESYILPANKRLQLPLLVRSIYAFQPGFIEPDYRYVFAWVNANIKHRCIVVIYTDFIDKTLSEELSTSITLLSKKHRVICCAIGNSSLSRIGYTYTRSLADTVFAAVVRESIDNRNKILSDLTRQGVNVIDVPPNRLCGAVLTNYTRLRWGR